MCLLKYSVFLCFNMFDKIINCSYLLFLSLSHSLTWEMLSAWLPITILVPHNINLCIFNICIFSIVYINEYAFLIGFLVCRYVCTHCRNTCNFIMRIITDPWTYNFLPFLKNFYSQVFFLSLHLHILVYRRILWAMFMTFFSLCLSNAECFLINGKKSLSLTKKKVFGEYFGAILDDLEGLSPPPSL